MPPESRSKRTLLLDARFQLKWTGYLVGVVLFVMAGLGVLIGRTATHASDSAAVAVKQAEKAFQESLANSILTRRTVQMAAGDSPAFAAVMDEELGKHDEQLGKDSRASASARPRSRTTARSCARSSRPRAVSCSSCSSSWASSSRTGLWARCTR